jgi:WD40 repeat protein
VTDFGLARRVEGEPGALAPRGGLTRTGAVVGTPGYLAPEQAAGKKALTTAADVYGLGAILFELLTGRPPFHGETPLETVLQTLQREPPRPRALNPRLDRDLETICLKCLEKDPQRRYRSAEALAEDLEHWLAGEPIQARPSNAWQRTVKWVRRRPAIAALSLGIALITVLGFVLVSWKWLEADANAREAAENATLHKKAADDATAARKTADERRKEAEDAREHAEGLLYFNGIASADQSLLANNVLRAEETLRSLPPARRHWEWNYLMRLCHGEHFTYRGHPRPVVAAVASPDGKYIASADAEGTLKLWEATTGKDCCTLRCDSQHRPSLAFSPDGKHLARIEGATVKVCEVPGGRQILARRCPEQSHQFKCVAYSPEGRLLAASAYPVGHVGKQEITIEVAVWAVDEKPQAIRYPREFPGPSAPKGWILSVPYMTFSPDGRRLAAVVTDTGTRVSGDPEAVASSEPPGPSPKTSKKDGAKAPPAVREEEEAKLLPRGLKKAFIGEIRVWAVAAEPTDNFIRSYKSYTDSSMNVAFSRDGKHLAWGEDHNVKVANLESEADPLVLRGHTFDVRVVGFSRDGKRLASGGEDQGIKIWDLRTGRETSTLRGHSRWISDVSFLPDGQALLSAGSDHTVKFWDTAAAPGAQTFYPGGEDGPAVCMAVSPEAKRFVILDASRKKGGPECMIYDSATGRRIPMRNMARVPGMAFSPDGDWLAVATEGQHFHFQVHDARTGQELRRFGEVPPQAGQAAAFSPDGRRLASARFMVSPQSKPPNEMTIWDATSGRELQRLRLPPYNLLMKLAFSPDGRQLAAALVRVNQKEATFRGAVCVWDTTSGQLRHTLSKLPPMQSVAFSPDGKWLAAAGGEIKGVEGELVLGDTDSGALVRVVRGHAKAITALAFSPDGQRLVTGSMDKMVKLWNVAVDNKGLPAAHEVLTLRGHTAGVGHVAFAADGRRIISAAGVDFLEFMWLIGQPREDLLRLNEVRIWEAMPPTKEPRRQGVATKRAAKRGRAVGQPPLRSRELGDSVDRPVSLFPVSLAPAR